MGSSASCGAPAVMKRRPNREYATTARSHCSRLSRCRGSAFSIHEKWSSTPVCPPTIANVLVGKSPLLVLDHSLLRKRVRIRRIDTSSPSHTFIYLRAKRRDVSDAEIEGTSIAARGAAKVRSTGRRIRLAIDRLGRAVGCASPLTTVGVHEIERLRLWDRILTCLYLEISRFDARNICTCA